jgi:hypothetical protein
MPARKSETRPVFASAAAVSCTCSSVSAEQGPAITSRFFDGIGQCAKGAMFIELFTIAKMQQFMLLPVRLVLSKQHFKGFFGLNGRMGSGKLARNKARTP